MKRPIHAKRLFVEAVVDVMRDLNKPGGKYDAELAKSLKPFVDIADDMAKGEKCRKK